MIVTPLFGINLGGNYEEFNNEATITNQSCNNCSIQNSTINSNSFINTSNEALPSFLIGVNFAGSTDNITQLGTSCNNCFMENVRVCQNTLESTNDLSYLRGFNINDNPLSDVNVCNDITAISCIAQDNAVTGAGSAGSFSGFYASGAGTTEQLGMCDNLTLKLCEVTSNIGIENSQAYSFLSTSTYLPCVRNMQLEGCVAKQNNATGAGQHSMDLVFKYSKCSIESMRKYCSLKLWIYSTQDC